MTARLVGGIVSEVKATVRSDCGKAADKDSAFFRIVL
jgi:hypothetical protein